MRRKDRTVKLFPFAQYPLLFGHRGCSKLAPENTLASFQQILDHNIPGVELDVQMCSTGEIIVLHDLNLKRTTGLDSLASETGLAEIKKLDAGSWFNKSFAGERIPTLDEVFELLGTSVYYDIEIKHKRKTSGELEKKLAEKIIKWNFQDHVFVSSFNPIAVLGIRKANPLLDTALIYTKTKDIPWYLHNGGGKYICKPNILKPTRRKVNLYTMFLNKNIQDYKIITWTVDNLLKAEKYINLGVDGIITNIPENMIELFHKKWDMYESLKHNSTLRNGQ